MEAYFEFVGTAVLFVLSAVFFFLALGASAVINNDSTPEKTKDNTAWLALALIILGTVSLASAIFLITH